MQTSLNTTTDLIEKGHCETFFSFRGYVVNDLLGKRI